MRGYKGRTRVYRTEYIRENPGLKKSLRNIHRLRWLVASNLAVAATSLRLENAGMENS